MNSKAVAFLLLIFLFGYGCANITAPTGGKKDTTPPKLVETDPPDSQRNVHLKRIDLTFDEFVTVNDAIKEVQISPTLDIQPTVTGNYHHVAVKIADTLLEPNTTYRISFGTAIRDLHEGNAFTNYTYTFSTGPYFDSLTLGGKVINAATGVADTGVFVGLYYANENDSIVVRHKPKYITKAGKDGKFLFKGLPRRRFKIFAIQDANNNLIYDGAGEKVAFSDSLVATGDTTQPPILLRMFEEALDTSIKKTDTTQGKHRSSDKGKGKDVYAYTVNVDTSKADKRTFSLNDSVVVRFSHPTTVAANRILLAYDSEGVVKTPAFTLAFDTTHGRHDEVLKTNWQENTVYTLKLTKGFAKDTGGTDANPARFVFRTTQEDDYSKVRVHLPAKYNSSMYLFMAVAEKDTIYYKPVTDSIISLSRLNPGKYTFRIIVDKNRNGKWDPGVLFRHEQPEEVIPYPDVLTLKAGWDNDIDFETRPDDKAGNKSRY